MVRRMILVGFDCDGELKLSGRLQIIENCFPSIVHELSA